MEKHLTTDPYKGVRDFYPEDMAVQRYIFDTWSKTAESFGFVRYDASILEPANIYRSKGAENEEMVSEQTYTFIDRGEREVTLRPEMTPTVARLIAGRRHDLKFPVKWYSIPNLFRYERPQRGRLREHWQLNCDIFGTDSIAADIEIISLANQVLLDFGATPEMFEIRVNHRGLAEETIRKIGEREGVALGSEQIKKVIRIMDRSAKIGRKEYQEMLNKVVNDDVARILSEITMEEAGEIMKDVKSFIDLTDMGNTLMSMGIRTQLDTSLVRGFDYYTGTIFEVFDKHPDGTKRALMGGGRYDNLTALFSDTPITGIGFGMGDVTMRDFLETHQLPLANLNLNPHLTVIPLDDTVVPDALKIAQAFRERDINKAFRVNVDYGTAKLGKKVGNASDNQSTYVLVVGSDELSQGRFTVKKLSTSETLSGTLDELIIKVIAETK
jgi:histidyl-tRNA synthetase